MAHVQNGIASSYTLVASSYMDAAFELVVHEESEIWTHLLHSFTKEGLLQLPS